MKKKFFISAGDPSGDTHAAKLMLSLKAIYPEAEFHGIGGLEMQKVGLTPVVEFKQIAVAGFWEVIKKYNFFKSLLNKCFNHITKENFDAFIPIDYPGFNIRLASLVKQSNVPVIYYIAPQLWAWGKNRANKLRGAVDKLLVVFPFEENYFSDFNIDTTFVGHPILDDARFNNPLPNNREKIIAFFPGSRKLEIKRHLEILNQTLEILKNKLDGYQFAAACGKYIDKDYLRKELHPVFNIDMTSNFLFEKAEAGTIKTGTSNLEAALAGLPFTMFYKASAINYLIGKNLINTKHVSLVNILLKKSTVKEFIQNDAQPIEIAREVIRIVKDDVYKQTMLNDFNSIRNLLGNKGASDKAAQIITEFIK